MDAQRDRAFAWAQWGRHQLVRPAQPARPREVRDQPQRPRLHPQVFSPPARTGHGLAVQGIDRRVEGFQHQQRGHIDAADGGPDGVPAQVVDQRFDLREFGHLFSVPMVATGCPSAGKHHEKCP
ncbi:hypothetical protein MSHO_20370 [Mycobacterium shottsii]|uniref:Uncharacterized protein n=1 Tax=Mycobacterium shottsii TaxID=133549 RepID=A0A7I7LB08_9MYCO|nr:hypothetical protein MSHO_20370 [Mycobacterium shottsii]